MNNFEKHSSSLVLQSPEGLTNRGQWRIRWERKKNLPEPHDGNIFGNLKRHFLAAAKPPMAL
jgi:hypothetical protein